VLREKDLVYFDSAEEVLETVDCWTDCVSNRMARDIRNGLTSQQKSIPSKYFYDAHGSGLFEKICTLPEYYVTRTELKLLRDGAVEIMGDFRGGDLVELGAGANWKIKTLLGALDEKARSQTRYVPVDVSETAIAKATQELMKIYPELSVMRVVADFMHDLHHLPDGGPKLILFLGSTIGNLGHEESLDFLKEVSRSLRPGDRFLLGMDMVKPLEILEAAYNDTQGVTAEFNRNVLLVVNRVLDAYFPLDHFDHLAFFNKDEEQVEMHLRANRSVIVEIPRIDLTVTFEEGETIHTEISRKFTRQSAQRMIEESGLQVLRWHTDPKGWFTLADIAMAA
jgi:L-histidine N-alpha-methyltransferase